MRYAVLIVSCLFILSAVFFSCKKKDANEPNGIVYDSISVSETYHLENDSTKPSCSVQVNYIYPTGYADAAILQKLRRELNYALFEDESYEAMPPDSALTKFVNNFIANYKEEAKLRYSDWADHYDDDDYFTFNKVLNTNVFYDKAGLLSYQVVSRDSKGGIGADTISNYRNVVIDIENGNTLTELDIFIPEYKAPLNHLISTKMLEQKKAKSAEELEDLGYFLSDLSSNNNFYVDNKGITYIFNPGEYSAVILGEIRIPFTYNEVFDILKPKSPISHLSGK